MIKTLINLTDGTKVVITGDNADSVWEVMEHVLKFDNARPEFWFNVPDKIFEQ